MLLWDLEVHHSLVEVSILVVGKATSIEFEDNEAKIRVLHG